MPIPQSSSERISTLETIAAGLQYAVVRADRKALEEVQAMMNAAKTAPGLN
jgi:hypothetical protein